MTPPTARRPQGAVNEENRTIVDHAVRRWRTTPYDSRPLFWLVHFRFTLRPHRP